MTSTAEDAIESEGAGADHPHEAPAAPDMRPDPQPTGSDAAEPQHEAEVINEDDPIDELLVGKPVDAEDSADDQTPPSTRAPAEPRSE